MKQPPSNMPAPSNEQPTLAEQIAAAVRLMSSIDPRALDAAYSDWYDWQDFLANGWHWNTQRMSALDYLSAHPSDLAEFSRFFSILQSITPTPLPSDWPHVADRSY